jgi:hypothetical protein
MNIERNAALIAHVQRIINSSCDVEEQRKKTGIIIIVPRSRKTHPHHHRYRKNPKHGGMAHHRMIVINIQK